MTQRRHPHLRLRAAMEEGALNTKGSIQALHGVPTFTALQDICTKYIVEHQFTTNIDAGPSCACRLDVGTYEQWLEHVTELQASHISMAIQEARSQDQPMQHPHTGSAPSRSIGPPTG